MPPITALVFIKTESERLPGKNFRLFNGVPLYQIMLRRLDAIPEIETVLLNSDNEEALEFVRSELQKGLAIERPSTLLHPDTSANPIITHDLQFVTTEHCFQTHVTNPLLQSSTIRAAIHQYLDQLHDHDSLFSVTPVAKRVYNSNGAPLNHQAGSTAATQSLEPVLVENSQFFLFSKTSFRAAGNSRIGLRPAFYPMTEWESIDIDYESEFRLAELIAREFAPQGQD